MTIFCVLCIILFLCVVVSRGDDFIRKEKWDVKKPTLSNLKSFYMRRYKLDGLWWVNANVCVGLIGIGRRDLVRFHIHIFYFASKDWKTALLYCMWLCIPEGKPIWQVKSLQTGREPLPEQRSEQKTIQTSVKTSHRESHWQKMLIGCIFIFFKLEKDL